ncbi:HNH endonuclease [Zooshikella sp. RANM57]|uniref:HNH endonuclease n=1 Tax=Zooshikella sp. RANM57 TaxID=3425863 RepID=UPI003D6E79C8
MDTAHKILKLDKSGKPVRWLTTEEAVILHVKQQILWSIGEKTFVMRGGISRTGQRSIIYLPSIMAVDGKVQDKSNAPPLKNIYLFRRDYFMCMYCGKQFGYSDLSRDHVKPRCLGGKDHWTNVVTACKRCNMRKGNKTPEEADMELLAVPFQPNIYEFLYLANHHVLVDQMEFLRNRFSNRTHWEMFMH